MFDATTLNSAAQYAMQDEIDYLEYEGVIIKPSSIVMLGAGPGVLALAALNYYAVKQERPPMLTIIDNRNTYYAYRHLSAMGIPPQYMRLIISDSAEAGMVWSHGPVGMLIVDGDHSTEGVLRDIDAWYPHVAKGGILFFHDYLEREGGFNGQGRWHEGEVAKALEQRKSLQMKEIAKIGISIVYRK